MIDARFRDRFMAKVSVEDDGCWAWKGYVRPNGYGYFRTPGDTFAHRVAWRLFRGSIPEGFQLDHLCRVRSCVNPEHLEIVTPSENLFRRVGVRKACDKYHPGQPGRWKVRNDDGISECRECCRIRMQRRRAELAAHQTRTEPQTGP